MTKSLHVATKDSTKIIHATVKIPRAATKTQRSQINKYIYFLKVKQKDLLIG